MTKNRQSDLTEITGSRIIELTKNYGNPGFVIDSREGDHGNELYISDVEVEYVVAYFTCPFHGALHSQGLHRTSLKSKYFSVKSKYFSELMPNRKN